MADFDIVSPPKTYHANYIDEICSRIPGARKGRFFKALLEVEELEYLPFLKREDRTWFSSLYFTPDAFIIDRENSTAICIEVVDTSDINPAKFAKMAELAFVLDEDYWRLDLVRFDRSGYVEFDILQAWTRAKLTGRKWHNFPKVDGFDLSALFARDGGAA